MSERDAQTEEKGGSVALPTSESSPDLAVNQELLEAVLDTLERVECQFWACDGPTLEPEDMVTCHRCSTLAQVRVALGHPPRRDDERTCSEAIAERDRLYIKECVRG